jgi:hypothetical protein
MRRMRWRELSIWGTLPVAASAAASWRGMEVAIDAGPAGVRVGAANLNILFGRNVNVGANGRHHCKELFGARRQALFRRLIVGGDYVGPKKAQSFSIWVRKD